MDTKNISHQQFWWLLNLKNVKHVLLQLLLLKHLLLVFVLMIENEESLGLDRRNSEKIPINICRTFLFLHFNDSVIHW